MSRHSVVVTPQGEAVVRKNSIRFRISELGSIARRVGFAISYRKKSTSVFFTAHWLAVCFSKVAFFGLRIEGTARVLLAARY